jgi:hypothetical protein
VPSCVKVFGLPFPFSLGRPVRTCTAVIEVGPTLYDAYINSLLCQDSGMVLLLRYRINKTCCSFCFAMELSPRLHPIISERMIHLFCIACHQHLDSYPAKDNNFSASLFICGGCTKRRRFHYLVHRRDGILGLAAAMALMNPSINFRQYKYIATDQWPQHNKDICNMLCHPVESILKQNAFSRLFRTFKCKYLVRL